MTSFALLFTLAAIGVSETVYLIRTRLHHEAPVCPIGGGCAKVLTSKYSKTLGVPNDLAGLGFYALIGVLTSFVVLEIDGIDFLARMTEWLIIAAFFFSLYLVYLQWRVIEAWCFWCLMSALTIVLMGVIVFL